MRAKVHFAARTIPLCVAETHQRTHNTPPGLPRRIHATVILTLEWKGNCCMAKATLVFAVLLVVLGLTGYLGTGSQHPTALIPAWIGLALGVGGFLAISPNEGRRKLFMHINVTIAVLGFLGTAVELVRSYVHASSVGVAPDQIAQAAKITLASLLLIYIILCVRAFIAARRSGKV